MNPTWNLFQDLQQMLSYPFMVNALRAGTLVAVVAGAVGWMMVLRKESFAGHTLAAVGFPGAAAATWLGISAGFGYFAACLAAAGVIALVDNNTRPGSSNSERSAVIGTVQAFALAAGMLFVGLYHGFSSGLTNLLFGTITGVSTDQVLALLVAAIGTLVLFAILGRPLLWASIDPKTSAAQGVPVRLVGAGFVLLLGIAVAGASQVTGSLLIFALLVAPAAAAHRLTAHPAAGIALSIGIALTVTWTGMAFAFYSPYPIGFWISTFAFAGFLLAAGWRIIADRMPISREATR